MAGAMSPRERRQPRVLSRRGFLGGTLTLTGALPFVPAWSSPASAADAVSGAVGTAAGYRSLTVVEARVVETMVNALCPADALTPDGVTSGLAAFIDAYLGGEVDAGVEGQRTLFRAGLSAVDTACRARHGVAVHELPPPTARQFMRAIASGGVASSFPLAAWSSDVLHPVLKQACFSGIVYDRYDSRMFYKLFG